MYQVTALKRGDAYLEISKGGGVIKRVMVTVNNRKPYQDSDNKPKALYTLVAAADATREADADDVGKLAKIHQGHVYKIVTLNIADHFKDDDAGDTLTYKVTSERPNHAVVAGYKKNGSVIFIDMLQSSSTINDFYIRVTASDGDMSSQPLRIRVQTMDPRRRATTYYVVQHSSNHNFTGLRNDEPVGYRQRMSGTLTFSNAEDGSGAAFNFAGDTDKTEVMTKKPAADDTQQGSYFMIDASGAIDEVIPNDGDGPLANAGVIPFKVTGMGTATVVVKYHGYDAAASEYKDPTMRKLTFTVSRIQEDPKVI